MRASDYLLPGGPISRAISGYEHRPSQVTMADAVEQTLAEDGVLLVEAGTGTGKTMAYLLPALLSGKRVVISTGTKTLQDQIMEHDLPLLERYLGAPVRAACMKGLSNYICQRRFSEFQRSAESAVGTLARQLRVLEPWVEVSETGDRAEFEGLADDAALWPHVTSSSDTRIGSKCSYFDECFVTQMRREAEEAQIIVVNHHLFFADLATRGPHNGGVIPNYDAVVFDEAHQIEDVVTQFFGVTVSSARVEALARDMRRAFQPWQKSGIPSHMQVPDLDLKVDTLMNAAESFFLTLPRPPGVEVGRVALSREDFTDEVKQTMSMLDVAGESVAEFAKIHSDKSENIAQLVKRAEKLRDDLEHIAAAHAGDVTWLEFKGRRSTIGASPVDVSRLLRNELFERTPATVLTSATLSTNGDFTFIRRRLGIHDDLGVQEAHLESPFDYASQAALYLPRVPDPRSPEYVDAAMFEILRMVELTDGGAFVLCTSFRMMNELSRRFREQIGQPSLYGSGGPSWPMLVQGDAPKAKLLERFREAGDAVLFATSSFWEGVDVPGHALRLVIMDKLPFEVPSDPLVASRCERLESEGQSAFMRYLVPSAAIALKQGFGRLIRTGRDRGVVSILDRRLTTKAYGRVFLRSLPPARRCDSFAQVEDFWMHGAP